SIEVTLNGEKQTYSGASFERSFTPQVPGEGQTRSLEGSIRIRDSSDTLHKAIPFVIQLSHPIESGALPSGLTPGNVEVSNIRLGDQPIDELSFPLRMSSRDFMNQALGKSADTNVLTRKGITVRGEATADTPIAGVAYSFDGGEYWYSADGNDKWRFIIPKRQLKQSDRLEVLIVAWTEDQYVSTESRIGPIRFRQSQTAIPTDLSSGEVTVGV
ncbi:MAG: hypothetical protein ABEK50_14640, partial [bacterium]